MHMRYSFGKNGEEFAHAQRYNLDASYKDLCEVCRAIRSKKVSDAMFLLGNAERMEIPIEYKRHNKKLGHRRELGGKRGRYPIKAVKIVKRVLANAVNNARVKQLEEDTLMVVHAAANKQTSFPRLAPKGRRMRWDYVTSRVEIVLKGEPRKIAEVSLPENKVVKKEKSEVKKSEKPAEPKPKESESKPMPAEPKQQKVEPKQKQKQSKKPTVKKTTDKKSDAKPKNKKKV